MPEERQQERRAAPPAEAEQERARRAAREVAEQEREQPATEGPEGGRYKVGERMVDAQGEEVKDK